MGFQKTFGNLRDGGAKKQPPTLRAPLRHIRSIRATVCLRLILVFRKWTRIQYRRGQHYLGLKHYLHETIIPGFFAGILIAAAILSLMDAMAKYADNQAYIDFRNNVQHVAEVQK